MSFLFRIVLYVTASLTIGILMSFIYFGFQRQRHLSNQQKAQRYIKERQRDWYAYLVHQVPMKQVVNLHNKNELKGIEAILFAYSRNFSDQRIQTQIGDFANGYLKAIYSRMLKSRHWDVRMNALYRVYIFGITELFPEIQDMMKKPKSKEEYFRILMIYSQYLPDKFFAEFFKAQKGFSEYQFKKLFSVMTDETRNRLIDSFQNLSTVGQYAAIELLGKKREFTSLLFLNGLLASDDAEIRIRTLKALHQINMFVEVERIIPFAESDVWQERLLAAKLFESVPLEQVKPVYLKLIEDCNWWVRNEAGRVLSLTQEGSEVLESVIEHSSDDYAVDVSMKFLLKGV